MQDPIDPAHESLSQDANHLRLLIDAVTEYAIYTLDLEGRIASWNTGAERIKGYRAEEVLGQSFRRFFPPESRAEGKPEALLARARTEGVAKDRGWRIRKDGSRFFAEATLSPIRDKAGVLRGYAKVTRDVTDRIAHQDLQDYSERLAESERRLQAVASELESSKERLSVILNGVDHAITAQDPSGKLIFANSAAARYLGYPTTEALLAAPLAEIVGRFQILDEEGRPYPLEKLPGRLALQGFSADEVVMRYREIATGIEKWSLVKATPIREGGEGGEGTGRVAMAINFFHDITALKLRELEERSAKEQLRVILEGITDGISVQDPEGRLLYLNQACANLLGFDSPETVLSLAADPKAAEAVRRRIQVFDEGGNPFPPEATPSRLALKGEKPAPVTLRFRMTEADKDHWVLSRAVPVFEEDGRLKLVVSILHDFTELREAEMKLRQSQKMEAVGRLAGGIAHDFNNLLTAINGYSDLLLQRMAGTGGEFLEDVLEIRKSGERAATLTQQLLAFSRKQILAPKVLDLNAVLAGMDSLLRRLIGEDIELRTILPPGLRRIKADQGQLEQVILNLALNARDAMPEGGKLTLETANVDLDASYASTHLEARPGPHVLLAVTDTGTGMDVHVKARLFEPFFTTKASGKGTGLGLSMVYGIVKQSGGNINVYSEPGRGTTFKIFLPATGEPGEQASGNAGTPDKRSAQGGETVLICEDEESVRNLVVRTLKDAGYLCLVAPDGEAALEVARSHPDPIHLLLTDVVLPGMNGRILAGKVAPLRPGIAVVYMSGYTDNAIVHHGVLDPGMEFLNKPFSAQALRQRVRDALARAKA